MINMTAAVSALTAELTCAPLVNLVHLQISGDLENISKSKSLSMRPMR